MFRSRLYYYLDHHLKLHSILPVFHWDDYVNIDGKLLNRIELMFAFSYLTCRYKNYLPESNTLRLTLEILQLWNRWRNFTVYIFSYSIFCFLVRKIPCNPLWNRTNAQSHVSLIPWYLCLKSFSFCFSRPDPGLRLQNVAAIFAKLLYYDKQMWKPF